MKASQLISDWAQDQVNALREERVALYEARRAYPNSTFLEYPLGEALNSPKGQEWAERFRSHIPDLLPTPCKRPMKIAEIPIAFDKVFDVTVVVLDVLSNETFKNMPTWFFCAIADDTGSSLFAVNQLNIPETVLAKCTRFGASGIEEWLKPGAVVEIRNAKSFPLKGVGAVSFTRTSKLELLGYDMFSYVVNFAHRDGQKMIP